jgi:hypothetical protein
MTNNDIVTRLSVVRNILKDEIDEWVTTGHESSSYFQAYGPEMENAINRLEKVINYFESHAKFDNELAAAYNEGWPDFVDGDII